MQNARQSVYFKVAFINFFRRTLGLGAILSDHFDHILIGEKSDFFDKMIIYDRSAIIAGNHHFESLIKVGGCKT